MLIFKLWIELISRGLVRSQAATPLHHDETASSELGRYPASPSAKTSQLAQVTLAHPDKDRALEQNGRLNGLTDSPAFGLLFSQAVDDDKVDERGIKAPLAVLIVAGLALLLMVLQGVWRGALFG